MTTHAHTRARSQTPFIICFKQRGECGFDFFPHCSFQTQFPWSENKECSVPSSEYGQWQCDGGLVGVNGVVFHFVTFVCQLSLFPSRLLTL